MESHAPSLNFHDALVFFGVAALLVPLLRSIRIHTVLAFLLAGVILGPYGIGTWFDADSLLNVFVIHDTDRAAVLAELGIVFLLFLIGLELSLERLWNMRQWIFGLGSAQLILCAIPIGIIAWLFGNSGTASILLGCCLALSSTAIVMQLINEQKALGSPFGQASFSILLLQDLAVIPLLLLVGLLSAPQPEEMIWAPILLSLTKALLAILLILIAGRWLLRPLFHWVLTHGHAEAFIALILLVAIGTAVLTSLAGLSLALGAFLAGVVLAETQYRHEIETKLEPVKGLLMGIFFMSVGIGINTTILLEYPLLIVLSIIGLMLIKTVVVSLLLRWQKFPWSDSLRGGLLLSQAGEFGFIVIGMVLGLKLLDQSTGQFMLFIVSGSMFLTPLANALGLKLQHWLSQKETVNPENNISIPVQHHILIAGCGRVGKLVAKILSQEEQPWLAVERSASRVEQLRKEGFPVIYGDITRSALLHKLHTEKACAVVITVDDIVSAEKTLIAIRKSFPDIPVYARARDNKHARRLLALGATSVIPDATEAGLQLTALTLHSMGVSEDARQRILSMQREKELSALAKPDPANPI